MRRHLGRLELRAPADYARWCAAHGFAATIEKSVYDLEEELQAFEADRKRAYEQTRLHANPRRLIEAACAGHVDPDTITRPQLRTLFLSISRSPADSQSRRSLRELLLKVNSEADFLLEGVSFGGVSCNYIDALISINNRRAQWLAPIETWRRTTHNSRRQFSSLVRHLLALYPVPKFMDQAWFVPEHAGERYRDWFIHLGAGKNIRTADMPFQMSKLAAHHFLEAPDHYTIEGALRWGEVHALGGDRVLTEALLGSRIAREFRDPEFWSSVIRFFVANPLLDRSHVAPIIDYLWTQRFETREVLIGHGRIQRLPPPQPNLSMRGRTAATLLSQVERWHRDLGRTASAENVYFRPSRIKELALKTGRDGESMWRIRQLLSGADLIAEGRVMRHCVASYARSCALGHSSIWALELHGKDGIEKRQTIEVAGDNAVVQCRGKQNRLPTKVELDVVKQWARHAGLLLSPYVLASD